MTDRRATLCLVGPLLAGLEWQRALARALGPLHPDGPRETLDDRLIRRWVSGERAAPDWVGPALAALCAARWRTLRELERELVDW